MPRGLVTLLLAFAISVGGTPAAMAARAGINQWRTPSGNVVCRPWTFRGYVNCVVLSATTSRGQHHFYVAADGRARSYFAHTHWRPIGHVLAYGGFWISGHGIYVRCDSRPLGLTCRNRTGTGHGFFLSRLVQRIL